jgi:hypothetical protein
MSRGRDDTLSHDRVERALAARRVRECGRCRKRRRDRLPRTREAGRAPAGGAR